MLQIHDLTELSPDYLPCEFRIKWADAGWEIAQARRLRLPDRRHLGQPARWRR